MRLEDLLEDAAKIERQLDVERVLRRARRLRRRRQGALALMAVLIVSLGLVSIRDLVRPGVLLDGASDNVFAVPPPSDAVPVVLSSGARAWLIAHDDGSVSALDTVSTHLATAPKQLGWCGDIKVFEDVQHGSVFDEYGRYIFGPAPTDLPTYPTERLRDGLVRVVPVLLPASPRSNAPHRGGLCSGADDEVLWERGPQLERLVFPDYPPPADVPELADVVARADGTVAVVDAILTLRPDSDPLLCQRSKTSREDRCAGPGYPVSDARITRPDPGSQIQLAGHFVVRVADGAFTELIVLPDVAVSGLSNRISQPEDSATADRGVGLTPEAAALDAATRLHPGEELSAKLLARIAPVDTRVLVTGDGICEIYAAVRDERDASWRAGAPVDAALAEGHC